MQIPDSEYSVATKIVLKPTILISTAVPLMFEEQTQKGGTA